MKKSSFWTLLIPVAGLLALAVIPEPCAAQSPAAPTEEPKSEATVAASPAAAQRRDRQRKSSAPPVRDHRTEVPDAGGEVRDHRTKRGNTADASQNHGGVNVAPTLPAIREQQVTIRTVASQPTGKVFTLNLSRRGMIYTLARGVDMNRIYVRTTKRSIAMAELLRVSGQGVSGPILIGTRSDMRARIHAGKGLGRGGGAGYTCRAAACICIGDDDCNDMFEKACTEDAIVSCDTGKGTCFCIN